MSLYRDLLQANEKARFFNEGLARIKVDTDTSGSETDIDRSKNRSEKKNLNFAFFQRRQSLFSAR